MKFRNGHWLYREGYASFSPRQVYEVRRQENAVELIAPTTLITGRGDTLEGINLTIRITAPMEDMIRVETWHHRGALRKGPAFVLTDKACPGANRFLCEEEEHTITVHSGSVRLVIDRDNWGMTYYQGDKLLTRSREKDLAYIKTNWRGDYAYDRGPQDTTYMSQQRIRVLEPRYRRV